MCIITTVLVFVQVCYVHESALLLLSYFYISLKCANIFIFKHIQIYIYTYIHIYIHICIGKRISQVEVDIHMFVTSQPPTRARPNGCSTN